MKEIKCLLLGGVAIITLVLYMANGTLERCPKCGGNMTTGASLTKEQARLLNIPHEYNPYKFCVKCGQEPLFP